MPPTGPDTKNDAIRIERLLAPNLTGSVSIDRAQRACWTIDVSSLQPGSRARRVFTVLGLHTSRAKHRDVSGESHEGEAAERLTCLQNSWLLRMTASNELLLLSVAMG